MSKPQTTIVQVDLLTKQGEKMTTWVDKRPDLKEGVWITLKDFKSDTKWCVMKLYNQEHTSTEFDWHRKWDNNI